MSFSERLTQLKGDLNISAFARKVGIGVTTLRKYLEGATPGADKLVQIARALNVDVGWLATGEGTPEAGAAGDLVRVPVLNVRASAGHGCYNEADEVRELLPMTKQLLRSLGCQPQAARIIEAHGSSMEPTIAHGDMLLVDTAQRDPRLGGIYVFRPGNHLQVKRVKVSPHDGTITFGSDNPEYGPFTPEAIEQLDILGRVVWIWRRAR